MDENSNSGDLIIPIAGLQFYKLSAAKDGLQQGTRLRLERRPDNIHDPDAIAIWLHIADLVAEEIPVPRELECDGARTKWMLGYIPAGSSREDWARFLSAEIDAGHAVDAYFDHGSKDGAWSAHVRLSGPAADRAAASVRKVAEIRRLDRVDRETQEASAKIWGDPYADGYGELRLKWRYEVWHETQRRLRSQRQRDIEFALGVPQQQHHERLKGTLRRQRPFLRDVKQKISAALAENGVVTKKTELQQLQRLQRDLDRVLNRIDAVVPTRPKSAPKKMRERHGLLIALAPVPASTADDDDLDDNYGQDLDDHIPLGPDSRGIDPDYYDEDLPF